MSTTKRFLNAVDAALQAAKQLERMRDELLRSAKRRPRKAKPRRESEAAHAR